MLGEGEGKSDLSEKKVILQTTPCVVYLLSSQRTILSGNVFQYRALLTCVSMCRVHVYLCAGNAPCFLNSRHLQVGFSKSIDIRKSYS